MSIEPSTRSHRVEQGDTLTSLALRYYDKADKWPVIQRANKLESEDIFVGEELIIPEISAAPVEPVIDLSSVSMSRMERAAFERKEWSPYQPAVTREPPQPKRNCTALWISGGVILAVIVFLGFAIKVPVDNSDYMERAKASCAREYRTEYEINNCAIRLGVEKLQQLKSDQLDRARDRVR